LKLLRLFLLLLIINCRLSNGVHAQLESAKWQYYGKYSFGYAGNMNYSYVGFTMENQFKPRWTLNWNLEFLDRRDDVFQLHGSMGLIGGPVFMGWAVNHSTFGNGGIGSSIILGLLIMAAPDGVSYNIPLAYRWDLSPYVNVLGFDWVQYNEVDGLSHLYYSASAGLRCTYWVTDRFFTKAFVETRKAGTLDWNFGGGLAIGWSKPFQKRATAEQ